MGLCSRTLVSSTKCFTSTPISRALGGVSVLRNSRKCARPRSGELKSKQSLPGVQSHRLKSVGKNHVRSLQERDQKIHLLIAVPIQTFATNRMCGRLCSTDDAFTLFIGQKPHVST